jgi:tetratricopeptide (TPR) repeat protein
MSAIRKKWFLKHPGHNYPGDDIAATAAPSLELTLDEDADTVLRQRALAKARNGNFYEAIALFNRILRAHPNSARDYNNRGLVYFQSGDLEAALADYNHALHLNPHLDGAYNNRANYYAATGLFLEAVLDYDAALDLNPNNIRAWINQGITFRDLQMYDRALESLDIALTMGQLTSHVYAERGRTYHVRGDWNCAIADYQRALAVIDIPGAIAPGAKHRLQPQINNWIESLLYPLESLFSD